MSNNFIEDFSSTISASQTNQILGVLNKLKERGSIRTLDEWKQELNKLTNNITNIVKPTTEVIISKYGDLISSEVYNFMLDRIQNDIKTLFTEFNYLDEANFRHNQLAINITFKKFFDALEALEAKLDEIEFITSTFDGYKYGQHNHFDKAISTFSTLRNDISSAALYYDPRLRKFINENSNEDAQYDLVGRKLIPSILKQHYIPIRNVSSIIDSQVIVSDIDINIEGNNILNIIETDDKYWINAVLTSNIVNPGVVTKVKIDLQGYNIINFIDMVIASRFPLQLYKVEYFSYENELVELIIDLPIEIYDRFSLQFAPIYTNSLILTFVQPTYENIHYYYNDETIVWDLINSNITNEITITKLQKSIAQALKLQDLINIANIDINKTDYKEVKKFLYTSGFDSIKIGYGEYNDKSIFVSKAIKAESPTTIGLNTKVVRFEKANSSIAQYTSYAFEYYIIKFNYDSNESFIDTEIIPILPANDSKITHERLVFNDAIALINDPIKARTSELLFKIKPNTLTIYKDGIALTITDYTLQSDNKTIILNSRDDFADYTASYTALTGYDNNDYIWLNQNKTAYIDYNNITRFINTRSGNINVAQSNIYLIILFRGNQFDKYKFAYIDQYSLGVGTNNINV